MKSPLLIFGGRQYTDPVAILTERSGEFVELPSGRVVDPLEWLRTPWNGALAGVLSYELAWELLDVRAAAHIGRGPRLWVARFAQDTPVATVSTSPGRLTGLRSRLTAQQYQTAVQRCVVDIFQGELFEVNYTARFEAHWSGDPRSLWDAMASQSTGDFFGYLDSDDCCIASVSPESFLSVRDGVVETRPIKGTRRRDDDPERDAAIADELMSSEKDRAENIMIVDLMRNDLTRVCELGSVEVTDLCALETFAGLHHLVSTIRGQTRAGLRPIDVLLACFPAGSITGAPKLRAIEIAAEVELDARGAYTGTMFVATPDELRSSVLIRTATLYPSPGGFDVEYGAGGAVVADSDPEAEWEEALTKCGPLRRIAGVDND